jgi:disulfide bond formation protein DsbB
MTPAVMLVTHLFATFIVLADALIVVGVILIILHYLDAAPKFFQYVLEFFRDWGYLIAFLAALGSLLGSLYYSQIAGFAPCDLCIIQRIFLYPQVLTLAFGLWKKKYIQAMSWISYVFCIVGGGVSVFHYYGQMFNSSALPCAAASVSCAKIEFIEYGYITIPMMALTASLTILISLILAAMGRRAATRG